MHSGIETQDWGKKTFGKSVQVDRHIAISSEDELAECLCLAQAKGQPVHPVSCGQNWGLGSRAPLNDRHWILDLSQMNAIQAYDHENGLVKIQPGVSFYQLSEFLKEKQSGFFVPAIGGPIHASVLANALERGDGNLGERWNSLTGLEVILPNGEKIKTGSCEIECSTHKGYGEGVAGPLINGLFSQSNLGIVTSAWMKLEVIPQNLAYIQVSIHQFSTLKQLLGIWKELQKKGVMDARGASLWNGIKRRAKDNPRCAYGNPELEQAQLQEWHIGLYIKAESLIALQEKMRIIDEAFGKMASIDIKIILRQQGVYINGAEDILNTPNQVNVRSVFWNCPEIPNDFSGLAKGEIGLLWICLSGTFDPDEFTSWILDLRDKLKEHGLDLNIGVESPDFRTLLTYTVLNFKRGDAEYENSILELYQSILETSMQKGMLPFRLANGAPLPEALSESPSRRYISALKNIADPNKILSSGRAGIL